jgi:hypothetical protein
MLMIWFLESSLGSHNSLIYLHSVESQGERWQSILCLIFFHHQISYPIIGILPRKYASLLCSLTTMTKYVGPKVSARLLKETLCQLICWEDWFLWIEFVGFEGELIDGFSRTWIWLGYSTIINYKVLLS